MTRERRDVALCVCGSVMLVLALALPHRRNDAAVEVREVVRVDTVVVRDVREVMRETIRVDTVWLERVDTLTLHDTVRIIVPIERKVYADSLYRAVVSGYNARLDSITVYPRTRIITREVQAKPKRWNIGIGAQMGYGLTPKGAQPYVGLGVSAGYVF